MATYGLFITLRSFLEISSSIVASCPLNPSIYSPSFANTNVKLYSILMLESYPAPGIGTARTVIDSKHRTRRFVGVDIVG